MRRIRDYQRAKVYRAERMAWERVPGSKFNHLDHVQAWIDEIVNSRWFRGQFPSRISRLGVTVKDGRGRRKACANGRTIKLPRWARSDWVTLHELAHVISDHQRGPARAAHGREFCKVYKTLVARWMGTEAFRALTDAYRECRVRHTGTDQDWVAKQDRRRQKREAARIAAFKL